MSIPNHFSISISRVTQDLRESENLLNIHECSRLASELNFIYFSTILYFKLTIYRFFYRQSSKYSNRFQFKLPSLSKNYAISQLRKCTVVFRKDKRMMPVTKIASTFNGCQQIVRSNFEDYVILQVK